MKITIAENQPIGEAVRQAIEATDEIDHVTKKHIVAVRTAFFRASVVYGECQIRVGKNLVRVVRDSSTEWTFNIYSEIL